MRQVDISVLTLGYWAVLATLSVLGMLGAWAAFGASLLGAGSLLLYSNAARSVRRRDAVTEDVPTMVARTDAGKEARRAVIVALHQPALVVEGNQITAFNAAAATLFRLPTTTSLSVASLRHPRLLAGIEDVRATGDVYECEIVPARNPGQSWSAHLTALTDGLEQPDVLIVLTDLAPVRRAERARADFLANASHELRTPLTSISGFVETMQGAAKDDKDAWPRFIEIIAEQASHMRGLISDLLSLSRIELGAHEVPDTVIDLHQTLSESIEAMGHAANAKGVQIVFDVPVAAGGISEAFNVIGSEGEVKQVIQNLLGNAIKYSPEAGEIIVAAGRVDQSDMQKMARSWTGASRASLYASAARAGEDDAVWFSVRDHGVGIAPEFLPRLGERFFRVDDSRGGPVEGTGLGLAIVKHIMAHHQGGLVVESIEGEGALFTVWFKAAQTGI